MQTNGSKCISNDSYNCTEGGGKKKKGPTQVIYEQFLIMYHHLEHSGMWQGRGINSVLSSRVISL